MHGKHAVHSFIRKNVDLKLFQKEKREYIIPGRAGKGSKRGIVGDGERKIKRSKGDP